MGPWVFKFWPTSSSNKNSDPTTMGGPIGWLWTCWLTVGSLKKDQRNKNGCV